MKVLQSLLVILAIITITHAKYGLYSESNQQLRLLDLQTTALVEGPYAEVQQILTYNNQYDVSLETQFYFPRTESSIFYKFEAILNNQTIVGQIFEKEEAKKRYEHNLKRGNTVAYSERSAVAPDVMNIKVGNIPPYGTVIIKYSIIQPLDMIANKFWGLTLPSVLTERYTPASMSNKDLPKIQTVEHHASAYKEWKILVEIKSDSEFAHITNPSHHFKPRLSESPSGFRSKVYKATWDLTLVPNKDFIVYFRPQKIQTPDTIFATHPTLPNNHVMLINFIPELNSLDMATVYQKLEDVEEGIAGLEGMVLEQDIESARAEFIFVIDRSFSM